MRFTPSIRWLLVLGTTYLSWTVGAADREPNQRRQDARADSGQVTRLPTADGEGLALSLGEEPSTAEQLRVICFLGTECPLAKLYGPRLQAMAETYRDRGVKFLGINSNVQDSMEDVQAYVAESGITFPLAKDYDRRIALRLGATRTPEVFVVDGLGEVRYHGRIDDQYQPGIARNQATQHDLRNAIDQLLDGRPVKVSETEPVGCLISLPKQVNAKQATSKPAGREVTFCNEVVRVLRNNCVECHRAGEIGPFALDEFDEVVGWAEMCLEVIDQGRMPPWHADPQHGLFSNARQMAEEDKRVLRDWVAAGMPYGDAGDLPEPQRYTKGWRLPDPPDVVLPVADQPFQVPAEGVVEYQYFVVDPGFTEDKWIRGVEVIPGNRAVVHHCIAFTRPPDGAGFDGFGMLSAYVPGQISSPLPDGYAIRVLAGSKIVFQMHYTPTGTPEEDLTRIGLLFAEPEQVTHEVYAIGGIEQEFEIPPHAAAHAVEATIGRFPKNGELLAIAPHMHLRGKSFELTASLEDQEEVLLKVPQYDFNWQHSYELAQPLSLDSVRRLKFRATFDNSAGNPFNPDPNEYVTWGDQTWQEMAVVFLSVARPVQALATEPVVEVDPHVEEQMAAHLERRQAVVRIAEKKARQYMQKHDQNGDGVLRIRELPVSVRKYGGLDHNRDGRVSEEELVNEFFARLYH